MTPPNSWHPQTPGGRNQVSWGIETEDREPKATPTTKFKRRESEAHGYLVGHGVSHAEGVSAHPRSTRREGRHWSDVLQIFPETLQSRKIAAIIMIVFLGAFIAYALNPDTLLECMPPDSEVMVPCGMLLASSSALALLLAGWALALALPKRIHRPAHQLASYGIAAAWWLVLACSVGAHWARWAHGGGVEYLPGLRMDEASISRHLERALGVAVCVPLSVMCSVGPGHQSWAPLVLASVAQVAQALVALSTGWHYDDDPSHAAYAAATVGIVVIFLAVEPMIIYFVRPGGTEAWWLWVVAGAARLWEACMRVAGAAGIGKIASLGTVTYGMLLSLLLIASGGAVIGFELMPWAALVLVLVSVMLVRVTGRTLAYSAVAALEDALTKDVADTVMSRALRGEGNTGAHAAQGPGSASGMGVARMSPPPSKRTAARDTQLTAGKSSSRQLRSFRKVHALEVQGSVHSASGRLGDVTQQGGDGAVLMSSAESGVSNQLTTADFMDVDAWKGAIAETVPPLPYLKEYCNVSLVFTDIVGYTSLSSNLRPKVVLEMLHTYFTRLDALLDRTGAFKYQTVGDAYVAIAGYPNDDPDHALTALRLGYAMIKVAQSVTLPAAECSVSTLKHLAPIRKRKALDLDGTTERPSVKGDRGKEQEGETGCLQIRVGIHTGPIAASTLGFKRSCLTLVGDTLNTAARMESNSKPGHIRITQATYDSLPVAARKCFASEELPIKGKGSMTTWIVSAKSIDTVRSDREGPTSMPGNIAM